MIGVLPSPLFEREVAHTGLTELRIVGSMHERKALMADLSDGFLALPGGVGTLDEWCEIFSWAQLGIHRKPFGLLNVGGYFDPLLELLDRMVLEGFLSPPQRALPLVSPSPGQLLDLLAAASRRAAGQAPPPPLDPSMR